MSKFLEDAETLEELVFQAIGAASTCWENLEGAGIFRATRAKALGDELLERLRERENSLVKLISTRTLINELESRIETIPVLWPEKKS